MAFKKITMIFILIIITSILLYLGNNSLVTTSLDLSLPGLPSGFDNYKILQISDLHGKEFGKNNTKLISKIKKISPDLIVLTGDLVDSSKYNEKIFFNFIDQITGICPLYFVTGNHEIDLLQHKLPLDKKLRERKVTVLRNEAVAIKKNGDSILLMGLDDPQNIFKSQNKLNSEIMSKELDKLITENNKNMFKILLSHRPEQFELYAKYNINLTFAGHAHGGQFRLPFIGGFYVPSQGIFPKYDSGKHTVNNSTMIVSRGLGNGSIPLRIFNRPELVVVKLKKQNF